MATKSRLTWILGASLLWAATLCFILFSGTAHPRFKISQIGHQTQHHEEQHQASPDQEPNLLVPLHPQDHSTRDPTTLHLDWTISKGLASPDGVDKWVYTVNGKYLPLHLHVHRLTNSDQFPCPNIEARPGDTVELQVHNGLDEGLALHFHGLYMRGEHATLQPGPCMAATDDTRVQ